MLTTALLMTVALASSPGKIVTFEGSCDASGALELGTGSLFLVGDDEDNVLRVYEGGTGGGPRKTVDVSSALGLPSGKKGPPETDIEAATSIPPLSFWLTSHGRKSSGKLDANRFRFFATRTSADGAIQLEGKPYTRLLDDLLAAPQLAAFNLAPASTRAPKEEGALNIEGLTAMLNGKSLLIGFRNPLPQGKALTVELLNPTGLLKGEKARLGAARLLDLGGLGIRSMSTWRGRYLLVGGSPSGTEGSRLFTWDGKSDRPTLVEGADFTDLNPEAFVSYEAKEEILVLSDDGTRLIDGTECKRLADPAKKRFRGIWVRVPTK